MPWTKTGDFPHAFVSVLFLFCRTWLTGLSHKDQRPANLKSSLQLEHVLAFRSIHLESGFYNDQPLAQTAAATASDRSRPHPQQTHRHSLFLFREHRVSGRNFKASLCDADLHALRPRPLDWPSWVQITGPWILEQPESNWKPPEDLQEFIKKAKEDKKPLVYCGFGSITVSDPTKLTAAIIESVKAADIRLILSKGDT